MNHLLTFEKIVPEGRALARTPEGLVVFCDGVLPGETAEVEIIRQKKSYAEARLIAVTKPAKQRSGDAEEHYLSCSPWQSVDYAYQLELKHGLIIDAFGQTKQELPKFTVTPSPAAQGYRNKLEFVFAGEPGALELALHLRGSRDEVVAAPEGCVLGTAAMNAAAMAARDWLNAHAISSVSRLIVRADASDRPLIILVSLPHYSLDWAALKPPFDALVVCAPSERGDGLGKVLYQQGSVTLRHSFNKLKLVYGYDSFFQINPVAFAGALRAIQAAVAPGQSVVELYGGVGTIGLGLAAEAKSLVGVEVLAGAAGSAKANASSNGLTNYRAVLSPTENIEPTLLTNAQVIVVDPPRGGLHPKAIQLILDSPAEQLVYLSCNPVTQARDLALLGTAFTLEAFSAYDFYPGTPHVESLATLRRSPGVQQPE